MTKAEAKKKTNEQHGKRAFDPFDAMLRASVAAALNELPAALASYRAKERAETAQALAYTLSALRGEVGSPAVEAIRATLLGELAIISNAMAAARVAKPKGEA